MLVLGLVAGLATTLMVSASAETPPEAANSAAAPAPFHPSNLAIAGHRKLTAEDFEEPKACGKCHQRQIKGWQGSMHSLSFKDPVLQAEWALAYKATDGKALNDCGGCHTPIGIATGTVKFDSSLGKHGGFTAPAQAAHGVSCDVCHSVSGSTASRSPLGQPGNASIELNPGETKYGPLKDAKSGYHETQYSELHTKAEFCGNCHNIFHSENQFPIEHTYDEWKASPYAQAGIPCQDCHMVPVEVAIQVADRMVRAKDVPNHGLGGLAAKGAKKEREIVHDHGFVGGNGVIAAAMGVPGAEEHKAEAIKRLQSAADLDMDVKKGQGGVNELRVKVTNLRAGHHLPTSLTFIRRLWLDVTISDDKGRVLLRSGELDSHNRVDADTVIFGNHSVDKKGNSTVNPWEIARFDELNTIPPKGFRYGKYAFHLPADAKGFKVVARLNYQSYDQHVADHLLGEKAVIVPTVEMKALTRSYDASLKVAAR
ncbi:MAG: cytochrome c family protein [Hydrogenophilales bacterium CG_4_10_14_3_um_filter_63_21]|nr:MAG: cytochrome c family protein [Hydrogenophilales bacterium CG_4_10_14_3_um_filter_63_21]